MRKKKGLLFRLKIKMLQVVFSGRWFDDNHWFQKFNGRQKKCSVYFYDYDEYVGYIIDHMDYRILERLRLNIYNHYKDFIKYKRFGEEDVNGEIISGYELSSDIIEINNDDFARLIPDSDYRKKFFVWNNIKEKYVLRDNFIYFVKTGGLSL